MPLKIHLSSRQLTLTAFFTVLTIMGGWIKIPMIPVPFTLQTLFVVLSGLIGGPLIGSLSQILYLLIGLIGLPVFSQGGGPMYVLQPTFGYLLAFPLAAFVTGVYSRHFSESAPFHKLLLSVTSGFLIIMFFGVTLLYLNLNFISEKPVSLQSAIFSGFIIFLPGDIIKILILTWITKTLRKHQLINEYSNHK